MSKSEAIELMKQGVKMTHAYFTQEEWVYIGEDGMYVLEDGVKCHYSEFWQWRQAEFWQDGWERFVSKRKEAAFDGFILRMAYDKFKEQKLLQTPQTDALIDFLLKETIENYTDK